MMNVASILVLTGMIIIFYILFIQNISYFDIKGIEQIITAKKVNSDGGITLKNLLNTKVDNLNLYEFILVNKNNEDQIKTKVNELMNFLCDTELQKLCSWDLEIEFNDKKLHLSGPSLPSLFKDVVLYSITLPNYDNSLVEIKLILLKT